MGRVAIAAIIVALSTLLVAPPAAATSCVQPQLQSSLDQAELVFLGVATVLNESGMQTMARFEVSRVFKGTVPKTVRVRGGGLTGATFVSGTRYLVFADLNSDGQLSAHLCGGTSPVDASWLKLLGAGSAPAKSGPPVAGAPPADAGTPPSEDAGASSEASASADARPEAGGPHPDPQGTAVPTPPTSDSPARAVPPKSGCGACSSVGTPHDGIGYWALGGLLARRLRRRRAQPGRPSRAAV